MQAAKVAWADKHSAGKSLKKCGYVEITRGPEKGRYEHVILKEKKLGRRLLSHEVVHHDDENKAHNSDENLKLMTRGNHSSLHAKKRDRRANGTFR
jgi:hypothetical protein